MVFLAERKLGRAKRELLAAKKLGADVEHTLAKIAALMTPAGMVYVEAGPFIMGNDAVAEEAPARTMRLEAFYIDESPVTNSQYRKFIKKTKYPPPKHWERGRYPKGKGDHPVVNLSWHDANAFATWQAKRLPTEAEWEKAGRGTKGKKWPWGNKFRKDRCNTIEAGIKGTCPVGMYIGGKSPCGCYDMAGNVMEWTADWYRPYPESGKADGGEEKYRVVRGGSWLEDNDRARCSARTRALPDSVSMDRGFRCVRSAD